jgi:hypothetical protein
MRKGEVEGAPCTTLFDSGEVELQQIIQPSKQLLSFIVTLVCDKYGKHKVARLPRLAHVG